MVCKKYFTLSFDDGCEQDKTIIELMKKHGLSGTFNLNSGLFGKRRRLFNINCIPKDEIKQVYDGFEIASHGYKHEMYRYMANRAVEESITKDIKELTEIAGRPITGFVYPYDMHTKAAEACLKGHGIQYVRRVFGKRSFKFPENPYYYTPTSWFNARNIMELLDSFIAAKPTQGDMLFMMWGHGYEMEYGTRPCSKEQLERIFAKIAGHEDIVYCTSREAFKSQALKREER